MPVKWKPPDLGWVKINVDGAFKAATNDGSAAGVCRDARGVLLGGFARAVKLQSAFHAETLAICEAPEFAAKWEKERGARVSAIEFDCLTAVQMLLGIDPAPWEVNDIVKEGRAVLSSPPLLCLTDGPRDLNKTTDWIVKATTPVSILELGFKPPTISFRSSLF
ncbi:hypothetical protein ACJRO7_021648 [Eucalyptus globulus]|uniref:RNase H type-1 domain-containing protein n=1 Tax=Eucalyptus globulus TaxID=34317 RepID=A0ABD3KQ21_EUCGL